VGGGNAHLLGEALCQEKRNQLFFFFLSKKDYTFSSINIKRRKWPIG
jgi:hypothetical protein